MRQILQLAIRFEHNNKTRKKISKTKKIFVFKYKDIRLKFLTSQMKKENVIFAGGYFSVIDVSNLAQCDFFLSMIQNISSEKKTNPSVSDINHFSYLRTNSLSNLCLQFVDFQSCFIQYFIKMIPKVQPNS